MLIKESNVFKLGLLEVDVRKQTASSCIATCFESSTTKLFLERVQVKQLAGPETGGCDD